MGTFEEQIFDRIRSKLGTYPGLLNVLPRFDSGGRASESINQFPGSIVYPFDGICSLAGCVSDIFVTFPQPVSEIYLFSLTRTGGIVPFDGWNDMTAGYWDAWLSTATPEEIAAVSGNFQIYPVLVFSDKDGNQLLSTADLTCKVSQDGFWYFSDGTGLVSVRYKEYRTADQFTFPFLFPQVLDTPVRLVSRCYAAHCGRVRYDGQSKPFSQLKLTAGDGITASAENNTVTLSAPGIFTAYEAPSGILLSVNGGHGDALGNFNINGDSQCIAVTGFASELKEDSGGKYVDKPHHLSIRNDCKACCSCEDYAAIFDQIALLTAEHNNAVSYIKFQRDKFYALSEVYNSYLENMLEASVKLNCIPNGRHCQISYSIANPTGEVMTDVHFRLSLLCSGDNFIQSEAYFRQVSRINQEQVLGDFPELVITVPYIQPHQTYTGVADVCFNDCEGINVEVRLEIDHLGREYVRTQSVLLSCEGQGETVGALPLPSQPVFIAPSTPAPSYPSIARPPDIINITRPSVTVSAAHDVYSNAAAISNLSLGTQLKSSTSGSQTTMYLQLANNAPQNPFTGHHSERWYFDAYGSVQHNFSITIKRVTAGTAGGSYRLMCFIERFAPMRQSLGTNLYRYGDADTYADDVSITGTFWHGKTFTFTDSAFSSNSYTISGLTYRHFVVLGCFYKGDTWGNVDYAYIRSPILNSLRPRFSFQLVWLAPDGSEVVLGAGTPTPICYAWAPPAYYDQCRTCTP